MLLVRVACSQAVRKLHFPSATWKRKEWNRQAVILLTVFGRELYQIKKEHRLRLLENVCHRCDFRFSRQRVWMFSVVWRVGPCVVRYTFFDVSWWLLLCHQGDSFIVDGGRKDFWNMCKPEYTVQHPTSQPSSHLSFPDVVRHMLLNAVTLFRRADCGRSVFT